MYIKSIEFGIITLQMHVLVHVHAYNDVCVICVQVCGCLIADCVTFGWLLMCRAHTHTHTHTHTLTLQVGLESLSMCLIDDCSNNDIPLLNFTVNELRAVHSLISKHKGKATAVLCGDYYNRSISAWEPVIEPWRYVY